MEDKKEKGVKEWREGGKEVKKLKVEGVMKEESGGKWENKKK